MAQKKTINSIAILCSGGDSPGMNACVRACVRAGLYNNLKVFGVYRGYEGLINADFKELDARSVGNILQRGGTILKSARSERFRTTEGRATAVESLKAYDIDALIVIGGNGSLTGAKLLNQEFNIPVVGVPGTIDNDLYGTDLTLGYDTALNTVMDAIDKIRDTADSHDRLFFVEVMGRDAGFIALNAGIAGGAESILLPEEKTDIDALITTIRRAQKRKKNSSIVLVAEGDDAGGAFKIAERVKEQLTTHEHRVVILGHLQRGGRPSCVDRVLASELGVAAVDGLLNNKDQHMVGKTNNKIVYTSLTEVNQKSKPLESHLLKIAKILSL